MLTRSRRRINIKTQLEFSGYSFTLFVDQFLDFFLLRIRPVTHFERQLCPAALTYLLFSRAAANRVVLFRRQSPWQQTFTLRRQ